MPQTRATVGFAEDTTATEGANCGDGGMILGSAGKSKMEIFREAFIEKASNFQRLLRLRASAERAAPQAEAARWKPRQRAIALQANRNGAEDRPKKKEQATADEIVSQRYADRVLRERVQGVPDHLKALISKAELDILQELFESSDVDNSGLIGVDELPDMLRILGLNPMEFQTRELLKEFDTSSDGELNFGEFVCLWYSYREEDSKENDTLETAFAFFDKNEDGCIEKTEFMESMTELGDPPLTSAEVSQFFSLIDTDNGGSISKEAFLKFCGKEASMALSSFNNVT